MTRRRPPKLEISLRPNLPWRIRQRGDLRPHKRQVIFNPKSLSFIALKSNLTSGAIDTPFPREMPFAL
jgi:hypothetical protein